MRNRTIVIGISLFFLASFHHTNGQTPTTASTTDFNKAKRELDLTNIVADSPWSKRTLDSMLLRHQRPLVLIKVKDSVYVFLPPNGCYNRRHFRGSYEERNNGGDAEKREQGGIALLKKKGGDVSDRSEGGSLTDRDAGGDVAGRSTGGDDADRRQAGNQVKRTTAGDDANRTIKGDESQRNAAGRNKGRSEAGETSDRGQKGEETNRVTEGTNQKRRWGGAFKLFKKKPEETDENVYCQKGLEQPTFLLSNVPDGLTVEVYDVMGRRKVEKLTVEYY